jgi:large subunit ribosomal protein L31e
MVKDFKEKKITINLSRIKEKPVTKRTKAALFVLKKAVRKETRAEEIKLSNGINETIWKRGLFKGLRKISVKVVKEANGVRVYLPEEKIIVKKEEKKKTKTDEIKEKVEKLSGTKFDKPKEVENKKIEKNKTKTDKDLETEKKEGKTHSSTKAKTN